jgi:hypothetical protein
MKVIFVSAYGQARTGLMTHVFPRTFRDACGIRSTTVAQQPNQHLAINFQEFGERKFVETHVGRESRNDFLGGLESFFFSDWAAPLARVEVSEITFSDSLDASACA